MLIREGENSIEIAVTERAPAHLPSFGDAKLVIEVRSHGFTGAGGAWIDVGQMRMFLGQLRELENRRQGSADLESMSPGQFRLRLFAVDRAGHMAVNGRLSRTGQELGFSFEFGPDLLPEIVAEFGIMCEAAISCGPNQFSEEG